MSALEINDVSATAGSDCSTVAAIDLGSNSFHMIVARVFDGEFRIIDRIKESVRLGGGLDARGRLGEKAEFVALACLRRFAERIHHLPRGNVRAVGTNTLRKARNAREFLQKAEAVLGHPIEIVSGQEEARLIYTGVICSTPPWLGRRLVLDIGGGSTEFVLGEGSGVLGAESVDMGCVSYSRRYFADGKPSRKGFVRAETAARIAMAEVKGSLLPFDWKINLGTSGTIRAVDGLIRNTDSVHRATTLDGLERLKKKITEARTLENLHLPKLREDRKAVLAGGLAILLAAFKTFKMERLETTPGGLKEGLIWNLVGRLGSEDTRESTIRSFARRFEVDLEHGYRVEQTAVELLEHVATPWGLVGRPYRQALSWAARLHEIGLGVSHSGYHKHGEYLVAQADMPGFSKDDQLTLATLIRGHRRALPLKQLRRLPHWTPDEGIRLCVLLRLAVLLNQRPRRTLPPLKVEAFDETLRIEPPPEWLKRRPLTQAVLEKEARRLEGVGFTLEICGVRETVKA